MKNAYLVPVLALFLAFAGCAGVQERREDAAAPAASPQETEARNSDAILLAGTGIDLSKYSYQNQTGSGYSVNGYSLKDVQESAIQEQLKRIAAAINGLHDRMPSVKDVLKEFSLPPRIDIATSGRYQNVNLYYGEVATIPPIQLYYGPQTAVLTEIRLHQAVPGYRFRGKLEVGSTFDEVFTVLGQPVERVQGTQMVMKDQVFSEATLEGGYKSQFIGYASEGVRFFGTADRVSALYLFDPKGQAAEGLRKGGVMPAASSAAAGPVPKGPVEAYADVRNKDLSGYDDRFSEELLRTLWFHESTVFPPKAAAIAKRIMDDAANPGLGVRALHARGITGKGVKVAIIDQNLVLDQAMMPDHPEYKGKVAAYKDVGTNNPPNRGSMHGPAVLSLLAGNTMGTAPDARVYFAAAPSWTADAKYQADALLWIIEENRKLPANDRIRVVSVSAAPSGQGSPFTKNNNDWDDAAKLAKADGLLVLDCTQENGIIHSCYYDPKDPENVLKCTAGYPGYAAGSYGNRILAPTSYRTQAEEYQSGKPGRQYTGRGGQSWSIPYAAGVLAMGWQVNPSLDADAMVKLLRESAAKLADGSRVIDPPAFIAAVEKTRAN